MAGMFGPSSWVFTCDASQGGSSQTITPYVREFNGCKLESLTVESDAFGSTTVKHSPIGKTKTSDFTIKGFFNTTATTGPHVLFAAPDTTISDGTTATSRTFTASPGDSKVWTVECFCVSYEVIGQLNGLTEFVAGFQNAHTAGAWS